MVKILWEHFTKKIPKNKCKKKKFWVKKVIKGRGDK